MTGQAVAQPHDVLLNGLDFIEDAVHRLAAIDDDQIESAESRRGLKYSLLHLSSGIELVLKYRLFTEHWTYVFEDMNKAGQTNLASGAFKSVGGDELPERLKRLCGIAISDDEWLQLKKLRVKRNRAEHFSLQEHVRATQSTTTKCIPWLIQFLVVHCGIAEAGTDAIDRVTRIKHDLRTMEQTLDASKAIASAQLGVQNLPASTCPECGDDYLVIDGEAECILCGYKAPGEDAASAYLENVLGISAYITIKDGGEWPVFECPECEEQSFVIEGNFAQCFTCGYATETCYIERCNDCGQPIINPPDGLFKCSNCISYRMERDD